MPLLFIFLVSLEAVGGEANVGQAELAFQNHLHVVAIGVLIGSKSGGLLYKGKTAEGETSSLIKNRGNYGHFIGRSGDRFGCQR